jgi:hypothetical protein
MHPFYTFSNDERDELYAALETIKESPYADYHTFSAAVRAIVRRRRAPTTLVNAAEQIRSEREKGTSSTHVLRNCPRDRNLPRLGNDDPHTDKHALKKTFIGEAFLELFAQLTRTPLLSYATRFDGDFFTDVISINKYRGKQTGYSDGDLVFHNDRTAHSVRADYISLLGMRCGLADITYTSLVEGGTLRIGLTADTRRVLARPHFVTPFDVVSRDNNRNLTVSEKHPILLGTSGIRYLDTHTTVASDAPPEAKDALLALKNALTRATKKRHRILEGDLLTFANQNGLHSRERIEVGDLEQARSRWLLKTYAFRDQSTADRHAARWVGGVAGMVGD